jgi:hypothetical protein
MAPSTYSCHSSGSLDGCASTKVHSDSASHHCRLEARSRVCSWAYASGAFNVVPIRWCAVEPMLRAGHLDRPSFACPPHVLISTSNYLANCAANGNVRPDHGRFQPYCLMGNARVARRYVLTGSQLPQRGLVGGVPQQSRNSRRLFAEAQISRTTARTTGVPEKLLTVAKSTPASGNRAIAQCTSPPGIRVLEAASLRGTLSNG